MPKNNMAPSFFNTLKRELIYRQTRLLTADEMKKVNFQVLFYGKSNEKDSNNHSNETILEMYQNGMTEVTKKDIEKEHLGATILEYIPEYISEDILLIKKRVFSKF